MCSKKDVKNVKDFGSELGSAVEEGAGFVLNPVGAIGTNLAQTTGEAAVNVALTGQVRPDEGGPGGGSGDDVVSGSKAGDIPTPPTVSSASETGVDADKRRRGKVGYAGTILTGPTGIAGGGNVGKTILGG